MYVFPEMKLHGLVPNSYIHESVSDLYIEILQRLNMNVLIQNGAVVSYQGLRASSGLNFSQAAYFRLVTAGNFAIKNILGLKTITVPASRSVPS
jgi:hypothetical protein